MQTEMTNQKKWVLVLSLVAAGFIVANAQKVGVGTTSPKSRLHVAGNIKTDSTLIFKPVTKSAASSISIANNNGFVIVGNTGGTQANAISMSGTPRSGQILYVLNNDNDAGTFSGISIPAGTLCVFAYNGSAWKCSGATQKNLADDDSDTRIQVEETSDDDKVRIDIAGTERWVFTGGRLEPNFSSSVFIGQSNGSSVTSASNNVAIGHNSAISTTSGGSNSAVGHNSLYTNTTGGFNAALGNSTLYKNTTGYSNVGVGTSALYENTTGYHNVALGRRAIEKLTTGYGNVAVGNQAGWSNSTGSKNVFIGYTAGYNETGSEKLYIDNSNTSTPLIHGDFSTDILTINGSLKLGNWTVGSNGLELNYYNSTLMGKGAGAKTASGGGWNAMYGDSAGASNTTGYRNAFFGLESGLRNTTGHDNSFFGIPSGKSNTTGSYNVAVGSYSLNSSTTADKNVAIGYSSLLNSTTGYQNSGLGNQTLQNNTTGFYNTAAGSYSMYSNTTGEGNSAYGVASLYTNSTGKSNTAVGYVALFNNTANNNTAVGRGAMYANTTGQANVAMGRSAMDGVTTGSYNIAIGNATLDDITTQSNNVAIGHQAGYNNVGSGSVFLGYQAGYNETGSSMLYISNSNTSTPLIKASFSSNWMEVDAHMAPASDNTYTLGISSLRWKTVYATNGTIQTSDKRFKKDIENMGYGLKELMALRSVTYKWKEDQDGETKLGFIAQELEQIVPEVVSTANDEMKTRGVNYAELIPVLVKAIQEQQQVIEDSNLKIENFQVVNAGQNQRLAELEAKLDILLGTQTATK